jgi:hypothetical protein
MMLRLVVWYKFSDVSEVPAASIIRVITMLHRPDDGTLVNFYQSTRRNIPEDSYLHTRHRESPNSHFNLLSLITEDRFV